MMHKRSWWVLGVWALAFTLLILNAIVSTYNIDVLTKNDLAVRQSQDISRALADLLSSVKDAETGQRGFLITGAESYLSPYHDARRDIPEHLARLQRLTADDPFYQEWLPELQRHIVERMDILARVIDINRDGGLEEAGVAMLTGEGKAAMDRIRLAASHMLDHEDEKLAERSAVAAARYQSSRFSTLLGGLITVLMVAMAYVLVSRELRARQAAEAEARRAADERAASERRASESLALLEAFLANAPIGLAFFDPDLRFVRVNEPLAAANGRPVSDHLGRTLPEAIPEAPPEVLTDLTAVARTGQSILGHELTDRRQGSDRAWLYSHYPVRTQDGRLLGIGTIAQDVTERHRTERDLRDSLDRFRTLADAVPQMVWVAEPSGRLRQLNRRWTEFTGVQQDQASDWMGVVHPDDLSAVVRPWREALANPQDGFTCEYRMQTRAGDFRWVQADAVPVRTAVGQVHQWVGTLTDIDDQKRQQDVLTALVKMRTAELETAIMQLREEVSERTRAEARAQASARELARSNEDLEKFAYVASHDLQEPLRKIQAFGDRLASKYRSALGPDGQEYVDRMKYAATRMRTLIDDLLAFSRVNTKGQAFTSVDLGTVVGDVVSDLEVRLTQSGGRVDVGDLPTVSADPSQMRQLFQNLIGNALKFHRPDTPPVVSIRATDWAQVHDEEVPPPPGPGVRITVADNGIGFEQVYAERVFELFQRLHGRGEYEGTGIGLAICRKIVQRHHGEITARSRPGEGTTFVIDLPVEIESVPDAPDARAGQYDEVT